MIRRSWQQDLFAEKSFGTLYRTARKHVAVAGNNRIAIYVFLAALLPLLAGFSGLWNPVSVSALIAGIRSVATLGVGFATSILGFLVSGFALFFAITRSDVLVLLAGVSHDEGDISRLQFILYSFMYVFLQYIVFLGATLGISATLMQGSLLVSTAIYWRDACPNAFWILAAIGFSGLAAWLTFILLQLKSFIWNLFQTVLVAITVGADMDSGRLKKVIDEIKRGESE